MYKKFLAIILVLTLVSAFFGCDRPKDSADNSTDSTNPGSTEQTTPNNSETLDSDNTESTPPSTSEPTLPKGEGVESIDGIEPSIGVNDGKDDPTEPSTGETDGKDDPTEPSTGETGGNNDPTEPSSTGGNNGQDDPTEPSTGTTDDPTEPSTGNNDGDEDSTTGENPTFCCSYAQYLAMTPADQQEYMNTFESALAFINWSRSAEAEHKKHDTSIEVEGGDLDVGDFLD